MDSDKLTEAIQALIESAVQAPHDFGGEQREWHLPRLRKAMNNLMLLFPAQSLEALEKAMTPYGTRIGE